MRKIALYTFVILLLTNAPSGASMSTEYMLNAIESITGSIFGSELKESNNRDDFSLASNNSTSEKAKASEKAKKPSRTLHDKMFEEKRFVLFNSRQLSDECRKYWSAKRDISTGSPMAKQYSNVSIIVRFFCFH